MRDCDYVLNRIYIRSSWISFSADVDTRAFLNDFIRFLSGALVPMWVFPESLQIVSRYLPFEYIYYGPITVLIGDSNSRLTIKESQVRS